MFCFTVLVCSRVVVGCSFVVCLFVAFVLFLVVCGVALLWLNACVALVSFGGLLLVLVMVRCVHVIRWLLFVCVVVNVC